MTYEEYIDTHIREMTEALTSLISVRSIREEAQEGFPFGKGPAEALKVALSIAEKLGLTVHNHENYVGTVDMNDSDTKLGILAHLDVVGAGSGWSFDPYAATVKDGRIYGRGASDDKGPAVAALFAMAAVQAAGIPLHSNVRLILGTDEESGSSDINYYFKKEAPPPHVFTPDGQFPVVNTEKGRVQASFRASFPKSEAPRIVSASGGFRINVVPDDAQARIEGLPLETLHWHCQEAQRRTGARFVCEEQGNAIVVSVTGIGGHAARPEKANNAITALLDFLSALPLHESEAFSSVRGLNRLFPHGDWHGRAAGIAMHDEISGDLTISLNTLKLTPEHLEGQFDSRTPLCANEDNTLGILYPVFTENSLTLECREYTPAHHTPGDSPFVQTLLRTYEKYTCSEGKCLSTGGGTYVHNIDGGVCFGCTMPGQEYNVHGADEFVIVSQLVKSAKIFAGVIVDLCGIALG